MQILKNIDWLLLICFKILFFKLTFYLFSIKQHCSGGELFDYIVAKSRLSETESQKIMSSLIEVLAYMHSRGFAHRDLKPENILFDTKHRIKLIDFGLAGHSKVCSSGLQLPLIYVFVL